MNKQFQWSCPALSQRRIMAVGDPYWNARLVSKDFLFIPNGIDVERFQFNASVREKVREELLKSAGHDKYVHGPHQLLHAGRRAIKNGGAFGRRYGKNWDCATNM